MDRVGRILGDWRPRLHACTSFPGERSDYDAAESAAGEAVVFKEVWGSGGWQQKGNHSWSSIRTHSVPSLKSPGILDLRHRIGVVCCVLRHLIMKWWKWTG